jgi:hypothetical protein
MTNLQLTYDFIRKSEILSQNKLHMTDNVIQHLGRKSLPKLARMLQKHKILTFYNDESPVVIFCKENNPSLTKIVHDGYISGIYKKDDNIVMLTPTKIYY